MPLRDPVYQLWLGSSCLRAALFGAGDTKPSDRMCRARGLVDKGQLEQLWTAGGDSAWTWKHVSLDEIDAHFVQHGEYCTNLKASMTGVIPTGAHENGCVKLGNLLPCVFIPTIRDMLLKPPAGTFAPPLWSTIMFYDERLTLSTERGSEEDDGNGHREAVETQAKGGYFYRILHTIRDAQLSKCLLLLTRIFELSTVHDGTRHFLLQEPNTETDGEWKWMLDFSDLMRETSRPSFAMIRAPRPSNPQNTTVFHIGQILDNPTIQARATSIRAALSSCDMAPSVLEAVRRYRFSAAVEGSEPAIRAAIEAMWVAHDLVSQCLLSHEFFGDRNDDEAVALLWAHLQAFCDDLGNAVSQGQSDEQKQHFDERVEFIRQHPSELANYFIWLAATHPDLRSYYVRHVHDFRFVGSEGTAYRQAFKPSGIVVASSELAVTEEQDAQNVHVFERLLAARAEVLIETLLSPLNEYYAIQNLGAAQVAMYARGAAHSLKNAIAVPVLRIAGVKDYIPDILGNQIWRTVLGQTPGTQQVERKIASAVSITATTAKDVDFLRRQAQVMFWIMDPRRMAKDIDVKDEVTWQEQDLAHMICMATVAGLNKVDAEKMGVTKAALTQIRRNVLSLSDSTVDFSTRLTTACSGRITFQMRLETVALPALDFRILENVLFELVTNAVARAATVRSVQPLVTFEVNLGERYVEITNTAGLNHAKGLHDCWDRHLVYEESGSRGVAGVAQMQLLVTRAGMEPLCSKVKLVKATYTPLTEGSEFAKVTTGAAF